MQQNENENAEGGFARAMLGAVLGGILGIVPGFALGCLVPYWYYYLFNPKFLLDGQWGMIYLVAIPAGLGFGCFLGAVLGFLIARPKSRQN